jgi:cytochrome c-type biogenesis protein
VNVAMILVTPTAFIEGLAASVAQYPLAAVAVAVAGGGLSTSVCPCTLPTGVGIVGYVGSAVGGIGGRAAGAARRPPPNGAALSLAFFTGLVAALTALGAAAAAAGRLLTRYDAAFSVVAAVVTGAVGVAALAGPWVRRRVPDPDIRQRSGLAGAVAYGVAYSVATITSSAGPLVLLLTVAAAMGRPAYGALLSFAFAVGRGLPFLALGLATGRAGGRLGSWLERLDRGRRRVEIASGVALVGLAGYFLWLAGALRGGSA